ncbi:NADH dehydrogenase [ubiquinone] 1 beta subcomplex subunit 10 [Diachasmimorpha longicaudata]|uniref:NADH dehydrogenase [ubiquinone] 1 beta subcomplex subunit 10 n=1 Tax=Diachasmimorpha longicaudata TaxID=58733 RepID=UPI0030B91A9D
MDPRGGLEKFMWSVYETLEAPVVWFREKIMLPNRQHYPWYHRKFRRVPTMDECYTDDLVCHYEANCQYDRDKLVDDEILNILRSRYEDCCMYNPEDREVACDHLYKIYEDAAAEWTAQHADLGPHPNVRDVLMKQKHRLIWERRHGEVGTGMVGNRKVPENN